MKSTIKWMIFAYILVLVLGDYGCSIQERGFALPEGDIEKGKLAFTELGCNHCHSVANIDYIGNADDIKVPLGGEVLTIKTYGDLVTSVINPSHKISQKYREVNTIESGDSRMSRYNEVMSVQELVDIVTFLQEQYEIQSPPSQYYNY